MKKTRWIWIGLAVALAVGALLSLAASSSPDGLERVAEDKGFLESAVEMPAAALAAARLPVPGHRRRRLATGLAGFLGTLVLFALGCGVGWALRLGRRRGA